MSRSPVREALIRLAGDQLVVTPSNRSTVVAPIDIQTFTRYVETLDIAQRMNIRPLAVLRTKVELKLIARKQRDFAAAVETGDHLAMSETNMAFHMAIVFTGRSPLFASFCECLLNRGHRMLHLHFHDLRQGKEGFHLTDALEQMLEAIGSRDIARADTHTWKFRDRFIALVKQNDLQDAQLLPIKPAA
jgi:DNA-binding GntR family transcriptional regulator